MNFKAQKNNFVFFFTILITLIVCYFPQLCGDYLGDDVGRIYDMPSDPQIAWTQMYESLGDRPLLCISIWVDRFIFKFDVFGMRLESLFFLALLCLGLRSLVNLISIDLKQPINPIFRDGLLLIFALHPLNTQAVGHIVQRGILFSTLLCVYGTWLLLKCNGNPRKIEWKVSLLLWSLALLAKPNIAFMPIWWAVMLYLGGHKKNIPFLIIFGIMLFIPTISYVWGGYNVQDPSQKLSTWLYFVTQGRALLSYFKLMILPWPLHFIHDFPGARPGEFLGFFLWLFYISGLVILWIKSKNKALNLFITGGFLAFLPESSFFPIIHNFFEHRTFTPMMFFMTGLSFIGLQVNKKWPIAILSIISVSASAVTLVRSLQVQHYDKWVLHDMNPTSCEVPYYVFYVSHVLIKRGQIEAAERVYEKVNHCPHNEVVSKLIPAQIALIRTKAKDPSVIKTIKEALHTNRYAICTIRNVSNEMLFNELAKNNVPDGPCILEDVIAQQLKFLAHFHVSCKKSLQYYLLSSGYCLREIGEDKLRKYQALKIRTILYVYFGKKDETLEKELSLSPDDAQHEYLRQLYRSARK